MKKPASTLIAAAALLAAGCSSPVAKRAQNADGLFGFILGSPGPDIIPVERVSRGAGEIVSAHATAQGGNLRVSGLVGKVALLEPPYGSHIDVVVFDAKQKIIAAAATDYLPRQIPRRYRGSMGYSHYSTRLPFIPPPGSTLKVFFHGTPTSKCEFGRAA